MSSWTPATEQNRNPVGGMASELTSVDGLFEATAPDEGNVPATSQLSLDTSRPSTRASYRRRRGGGGSERDGSSGSSRKKGLYSDAELDALEATYAEGITAVQAVELFVSRGVRLSEASFRKYVQQGLLPRSRRVGRKGKHRGSMGMYPSKTVRRINEIKRLMGEGYTIEEIQAQFLRFTNVIETLNEGFQDLFVRLEEEIEQPRFDKQTRRAISRDVRAARKDADKLMAQLDGIAQRVSRRRGDEYRNPGAAGSAEDLL